MENKWIDRRNSYNGAGTITQHQTYHIQSDLCFQPACVAVNMCIKDKCLVLYPLCLHPSLGLELSIHRH